MEIELKLLIAPEDVAAFRRHRLIRQFATGKAVTQQLVSTYYDTPDLLLKQHRMALRVRKQGRSWIQTLKGGGRVDGALHQRDEWECAVRRHQLDLPALLPQIDSPAARLLMAQPGLAGRLEEIFTTSFRRTAWMLSLPGGAQVELALDQGSVSAGNTDRTTVINEIELELKSGDAAALFAFALALQETITLVTGNISKAERGFLLHHADADVTRTATLPYKAAPPAFGAQTSVVEAAQRIVRSCMAHMQRNAAGVIVSDDGATYAGSVECLHQMRVGLRRLQSCIAVFKRQLTCPDALRLQLADINRALGAARDWDILAHVTIPDIVRHLPDEAALEQLRQRAVACARRQHGQAAAVIGSVAFSRLMLMLAAWLHTLQAKQAEGVAAQPGSFLRLGKDTIVAGRRKLLKRAHRLDTQMSYSPKARHRLRIAVKKARYPLEFLEGSCNGKPMRRYLRALARLQETLGQVTDATAGTRMLLVLAQQHGDLAHAAGVVRGYLTAQARRKEKKAMRLWKNFVAQQPPLRKEGVG